MKEIISPQVRQIKLYEFFLYYANLHDSESYIPKEFIVVALKDYYPRHLEECHEVDSTVYSNLRKDIRAINNNDLFTKIIVSSQSGYKIANEEELKKYLAKKKKTALRMLSLIHSIKNKTGLNVQQTIDGEIIKVFVDSENDYIL